MKRILAPSLSLLVIVLAGSGCVPYQTYDRLKSEYGKAKKINEDLAAKYNQLVQAYSGLRGSGEFGDLTIQNLQERLQNALAANEQLAQRINELNESTIPSPAFTEADIQGIPGASIGPSGQLVIEDAILFNSGEASLKNKSLNQTLDGLAQLMKGTYAGEVFHIVGHTDNVPLSKTKERWEYNVRLGWERAYTVFKYLNKVHKIPEGQIVLHSYGFLKPTNQATKNTPEGRAKNRRVEVYRSLTRL